MIYYSLINKNGEKYISKNKVSINKEKLEEVKEDIIANCSDIIHHSYKGTNFDPGNYSNIINIKKEFIGKKQMGLYTESIYNFEFDEIRHPEIVSLINRVVANPFGAYTTKLLDIVNDFDDVNYNEKVKAYYPSIRECFTLEQIKILPISVLNRVINFFECNKENRIDNSIKRIRRINK